MSNQKTPNLSRNKRRSSANYSRSIIVEDKKQSIFSRIRDYFVERKNNYPNKEKKNRIRSGNKSRDFSNNNVIDSKTMHRRKKTLLKKYLLIGMPAILITAFVFILLLNNEKPSDDTINENKNTKSVIIYINNNEKIEINTELNIVGDLLKEQEISMQENQRISHGEESVITDGMKIYISTPIKVYVIQNGIKNAVTVYGGTVEDALNMMEVNLDKNDIVDPAISTLVKDEMTIEFIDIEIKKITETEEIPFDTEEGETDTVETGYFAIDNEGKAGVAEVTYEVKYVNGEEIDRTEIGRLIVEEPISKVVLWGTAAKSSSSSSGSSSSSSSDSSNTDTTNVPNPNDQVTNPSVPAKPTEYIRTMSGHVTAYTHTGSGTATGTWPRSTRTLDNPGTCAVVPSTIPYGSLLYVTGYGYCIAEDTGAFRNDPDRWNQIDLFMNTRDECMIWGRRRDVVVYILREGY